MESGGSAVTPAAQKEEEKEQQEEAPAHRSARPRRWHSKRSHSPEAVNLYYSIAQRAEVNVGLAEKKMLIAADK